MSDFKSNEYANLFGGSQTPRRKSHDWVEGCISIVACFFDERFEGVKRIVKFAIATAKAKGRKIGICGQAPSGYPEFAQFLVELGIDSISLNPDRRTQAPA